MLHSPGGGARCKSQLELFLSQALDLRALEFSSQTAVFLFTAAFQHKS